MKGEKLEIVQSIRFFRKQSSLRISDSLLHEKTAQNLDIVGLTNNESSSTIELVDEGSLRIQIANQTRKELLFYRLQKHESCRIEVRAGVTAIERQRPVEIELPTHTITFPATIICRRDESNQEINLHIIDTANKPRSETITMLEEVAFRKTDQRLASFLIDHFEEKDNVSLLQTGIQKTIARAVGSTTQMTAKLLMIFERNGAVTLTPERIYLQDKNVLFSLAGRSFID